MDDSNIPDPSDTGFSSDHQEIVGRAIEGSALSLSTSAITWILGGLRLVLLTHWLLPHDVGLATQALVFVALALQFQQFGLDQAFVSKPEVDRADLATFSTMRIGFQVMAMLLLAGCSGMITSWYPQMPMLGAVLTAFAAVEILRAFNSVQLTTMKRNMNYRPMALMDLCCSLSMTVVAPILAWRGFGVWSLVGEQAAAATMRAILLYGFYGFRVTWGLKTDSATWFLRFGKAIWASTSLGFVITRFDEFWVGRTLGASPLGVYSRAYEFSCYPRRLISNPLVKVFLPTFARLQNDRVRLSKAFFRATAFIIRTGFLIVIVFLFTAKDLVQLIGPQWLDMVPVLQTMLLFTLLNPICQSANGLLVATGRPGLITRIRLIQVLLFVPGTIFAAKQAGILGVAMMVNVVAAIASVMLFASCRRVVDYSVMALFFWPSLAAASAAVCAAYLNQLTVQTNPAGALVITAIGTCCIYAGVLWAGERQQIESGVRMIADLLRQRFLR